jgi:allantoate deiminase
MVTIVHLDVEPAPAFLVKGSTTFGVAIHTADDAERHAAMGELGAAFEAIAHRRFLEIGIERGVDPDATRCDLGIVSLFEKAVEATGYPVVRLAQGATTDATNLAVVAPIGSLLIRCRGGVGWGPNGSVDPADIEIGIAVLTDVVSKLAGGQNVASPTGD